MSRLLVVGGGLFGSPAAAYARVRGIEATVFDAGLPGSASHAAAGLFAEEWAGKKLGDHFRRGVGLLEKLYGISNVSLTHDDGGAESFLFVPPTRIMEPAPVRETVTVLGDGWLEAGGRRHEGWVYVAAGVWCQQFHPSLNVYGKSGAAFMFDGETQGRIRPISHGRQAIAFVRDAGVTYFSDGAAERNYIAGRERETLQRATAMGLSAAPIRRMWGQRPYVPGGPVFMRLGERTWLATGGRKMGTVLGASFARRLIDEELR